MASGDDKRQARPPRGAGRGEGAGAAAGAQGSDRGDRLAAALRTNLAKRKQQGRARARLGTTAEGISRPGEMATAPASPLEMPAQVASMPHDSAEIITEKSGDQAD